MREKIFCILILSAIFLLIGSGLVSAGVGMTLPSRSERSFEAVPGFTKSWDYPVHGAERIAVSLEEELASYAELEDPNPNGGARTVRVTITIPEDTTLGPGDHYLRVRAQEMASSEATVVIQAAVTGALRGWVYADYPFLEATLQLQDRAEGESVKGDLHLKSYSTVPIQNIRARVTIADDERTIIDKHETTVLSLLAPLEERDASFEIPADLEPGTYTGSVELLYTDGVPVDLDDSFRVGSFSIELLKAPEEIYRGKINKVEFSLKNEWNELLSEVPATAFIDDLSIEEEAPRRTLLPFSEQYYTFYLEPPADAALKTYDGYLELEPIVSGEKRTVRIPFTTKVAEGTGSETQIVSERPSAFGFSLNPLTGAYLLVLLLVIINVILLFRRRK